MTFPRRARELVIVAILLALPVLVLRANLKAPSRLNALDRAVLRVSAPLQTGLTGSGRAIGGLWSRYIYLVHVKEDNARLVDENARLEAALTRTQQEAKRGAGLEKLLQLKQSLPATTLAARVVGVETSPLFRVVRLRLDRGVDASALRPGLPVLAAGGIVGRIERVFGPYSDVLLAADPKSSIDVVLARTGARGIVEGIAGDNKYRTRIEFLLRKDEVAVGDPVVTSGLGGVFPRDLPVGRVTKVVRRDFGLYQEAEVEPAVDFSKLNAVLIVVPPQQTEATR